MPINGSNRLRPAAAGSAFAPDRPSAEDEKLMAEYGIGFDGRSYRYREYRYDRLADAVNYARLEMGRPGYVKPDYVPPARSAFETPDEAQLQAMADYAISFDGKYFRYGAYRYERCADAINYARLDRSRPA